jgi:anti-sigma factor RsiW
MNACERLSDRMPDVVLHRSEWTPEEAAHLAACAECRAEWELVLAARALGDGAPTVSDPSALSAALQRRLAEDRAGRARARRAWSFAGAAAAAAGILVAVMTERDAGTVAAPQAAVEAEALVPLPELEGLETAQLDTLLHSIDRPFAGPSTLDASTLGEHEDGELEQVFATWEG